VKDEGKKVKKDVRRTSVEVCRAKVTPHSNIRSQLKMLSYCGEDPGL
jgi:hypothetical protein